MRVVVERGRRDTEAAEAGEARRSGADLEASGAVDERAAWRDAVRETILCIVNDSKGVGTKRNEKNRKYAQFQDEPSPARCNLKGKISCGVQSRGKVGGKKVTAMGRMGLGLSMSRAAPLRLAADVRWNGFDGSSKYGYIDYLPTVSK
jgi:hypothetical protein